MEEFFSANVVSGTLSASGISPVFTCDGALVVSLALSGTWTGSAIVQRSVNDGATWESLGFGGTTLAAWAANHDSLIDFPARRGIKYRVSATITAGTLEYRLGHRSRSNSYLDAAGAATSAWAASAGVVGRSTLPKVAFLGDSRGLSSHSYDSARTYPNMTLPEVGLAYHIEMMTGLRVELPQRLNFCVGSSRTSQQIGSTFTELNAGPTAGLMQPQMLTSFANLTPLEACAQSDANVVIIITSTNDRTGGLSYDQTVANLTVMHNRLLAAGKIVIQVAEMPRGDTNDISRRLAGTVLQDHLHVANWTRSLRRFNLFVADAWRRVALASSATGDAVAGMLYDSLHMSFAGAFRLASEIAPIINSIYPPFNRLPGTNTDVYSANNPTGSLLSNPMVQGSGGTVGAAASVTISGNLPDSYSATYSNANGLTVAYGSTTIDDILFRTITLSGTPSVANPRIDISSFFNVAQINTGDMLQTIADFRAQAGSVGLNSLVLQQELIDVANTTFLDTRTIGSGVFTGSSPTTTPGQATAAWGGPIASEPSSAYNGAGLGTNSRIRYRIYMTLNVAVNAVLLFGPTATRKVIA